MNGPVDLSIYKEALLFLVTAGVVAPLFFRLRVSPVLGYLLAGVALGPYGLGALARSALAQRACDRCRGDRPNRRIRRRHAYVHDGARAVLRAAGGACASSSSGSDSRRSSRRR